MNPPQRFTCVKITRPPLDHEAGAVAYLDAVDPPATSLIVHGALVERMKEGVSYLLTVEKYTPTD